MTASLIASALPVLASPASAAPSTTVVIGEVYGGGGNSGATLKNDFVELRNLSSEAVSVAGWSVQYASSAGTSWQRTALTGSIPAGGTYLVQQAAGNGGTTDLPSPDVSGSISMGGPSGKVALTDTSALCAGPACAGDDLVDLVGYGSANAFEGRPTPALSNTTSASRTGGDTDDNAADFTVGAPSPSTSGTGGGTDPQPPAATTCDVTPTAEIGAVQGSGGTTPLGGQTVTVRGTVVGDLPGLSGFYLQDPDGDGDPATSDGLFVYSRVDVGLGDTVAVTGRASEYGGQTQVSSSTDVQVCTDGTPADLPAATPLDLPADDAAREALEGMLVAPADDLTVSEVYALTRYGELTLSQGGILVQPTELARPGTPEAAAVAEANELRSLVLDDGVSAGVSATTRPYLSPTTPVRVGDVLDFTAPVVLGEGFGAYRLQPADGSAAGTFAAQNTRPDGIDDVGGNVQVGAFNVLNYFLTIGGVGRGARSAADFEEQAAKIVTAIDAMDADVLTLMEIEDTASTGLSSDPDVAVADLVRRLNDAAGREKWAYVPFPAELLAVARDVIRNAILYQPAVVSPVGAPVGLVDEVNFDNAREPIAQTFSYRGDAFTVIANHFKSKGSGEGDNADQGDGQGASNLDRIGQAEALAGFVRDLRASAKDPDVMVVGDLNAYSQEDPIQVLRDAGLTDLGERFDAGRYSYVFDALSGSLDHAMATGSLTAKVTDVAHWNINSVESFAYQYSGDPALYAPDEFRSSDHDPLLVGLDLRPRPGKGPRR